MSIDGANLDADSAAVVFLEIGIAPRVDDLSLVNAPPPHSLFRDGLSRARLDTDPARIAILRHPEVHGTIDFELHIDAIMAHLCLGPY